MTSILKINKGSIQKAITILITALILLALLFFQENELFLSLISIAIFGLVLISSEEYNIYYLFTLLPFYMLLLIKGNQLYNLIIFLFLGKYMIRNLKTIKLRIFILPLVIGFFEFMHSVNSGISSALIKWLLTCLTFSVLLCDPNKNLKTDKIIKYFVLGMACLSISIIYYNGDQIIDDNSRNSLEGIAFIEKNTYSIYGCVSLMSILYLLKMEFKKYKWYILPFCVILLSSILMISKTFLIITIICLSIFYLISVNSVRSSVVFLLTIFVFIILVSTVDYLNGLFNSYLDRFTQAEDFNELTTGRWAIFQEYINYLLRHPKCLLIGEGMFSYIQIVLNTFIIPLRPHNVELEMLISWGIIGSFIIIYLVVKQYFRTKSTMMPIRNKHAVLPLVALLLGLQTITLIYQNITMIIFIYCFYILLYNRYGRGGKYVPTSEN